MSNELKCVLVRLICDLLYNQTVGKSYKVKNMMQQIQYINRKSKENDYHLELNFTQNNLFTRKDAISTE